MSERSTPTANYAVLALDLFTQYGADEALIAPDGRRFSYAEVRANVIAMAGALVAHGVGPGTAVGVLAHNPPESIFLQLGAHLLGCRTAWVAPNTPTRFREEFIQLAEVDIFIYDTIQFADMGAELIDAAGPVPVFCFGAGGRGADLTAGPAEATLSFDPAGITDEPSSLFQTGGTTGTPKLVHHRHAFFQALHALSVSYLASGEPRLRHQLASGTWHVSSQTAAFMTLFTGGTLFLSTGMNYDTFLGTIERERINSTLLPPPLLYRLLDHPGLAGADCASLRTFTISGSAAAPARMAQAIDRFGPVLRIVYGMSEAPFITALPNLTHDPAHPHRLGSCGLPYGDIVVEIRDDAGQPVAAGQVGEVWVSGSLVMSGYWGRPDLTAEALVGGWLRTGDIGRLDDDGYLYLVDRVKDMIVTGNASSNVYCRPIEDVLAAHPQVRAAAVIGVPHEQVGEAVHAFVVAAPGATMTGEQLRQHVTDELNELWSPREVTFVDALPLTGSGKVDKVALRHRHLAASLVREESARPETAAGNSGHSEQQPPPPPERGASPASPGAASPGAASPGAASAGAAGTGAAQPHSRTTLSP